MRGKYHALVPPNLWNYIDHILRGRMLALAHKGRTMKEDSRLMSCVVNGLKANEENFNSERFGNLTPEMAAQESGGRLEWLLTAARIARHLI